MVTSTPLNLQRVGLSVVIPLIRSSAPPPDGNRVRQGLLAALREADPDLPELLHADPGAGGHPWSVSAAFHAWGRWWIRVTGIGERVCAGLGDALRPGRLAATGGWCLAPSEQWRARAVRIDQLTASTAGGPSGTRRWVASLLTPTLFSDSGARGTTATPYPWSLVGGWWRRWGAHLGVATLPACIPAERDEARDWLTDRVRLHTGELRINETRSSRGFGAVGAVGPVLLDVSGDPLELAALTALLRFGTFSGTGRKLAFGFGQTAVASAPFDLTTLVQTHRPLGHLTSARPVVAA